MLEKTFNSSKIRFIKLILPILCCWQLSYAQISYQKFPLNNQILQRNDQNQSIINVKGIVTEEGHSSVTLRIYQNENLYYDNTLNFSGNYSFDFTTGIQAGKYNYTVKLYLDGHEVKTVTRVASGDIFLIYGQSNAFGFAGINDYQPARDPYLRYYVMYDFNNSNGEWLVPYETSQWPGTGLIALELQRLLSQNYNYPVGVMVAAVGGASISNLNNRNSGNPKDINTPYGKMLTQINAGSTKEEIKYLIFRHGETDSEYYGNSEAYPEEFAKFYNNINNDLPGLRKIYNMQANILTPYNHKAGFLRDFQRRSKYLFPKISTLSSVGTRGYEGLHYNFDGYKQTAMELSRVVGREIYGDHGSLEVYSPDIQRIYWEGNRLVLEFDAGMQMVYPQDSVTNTAIRSMKDFIYIDGRNDVVQSGEGIANKIYLNVAHIDNPGTVSYLPSSFADNTSPFYNGIHLKNSRGMRAFSFDNVAIGGEAPQAPTDTEPPVVYEPPVDPQPETPDPETPETLPTNLDLSLSAHEQLMVKLSWNGNVQTKYRIERSTDNPDNFTVIGTIYGDNYYDTQVRLNKRYFYRVSTESNSEISTVKEITLTCLDNLVLQNLPSLLYVGANTSITAIISVSSSKQLTLEANKFIDLNSGFDAAPGSYFNAQIGGCKSN